MLLAQTTVYDIQTKYDQFVWIPVDQANKPMYKVATAPGYASTDANNPNYEGVLYSEFNTTPNSGQMSSYGQGGTEYREPDVLSKYRDGDDTYLNTIKSILTYSDKNTDYSSGTKFQETMQKDYNQMVKSVEYYGGFWIGRYESSLVNGRTRIISGKTSLNCKDIFTVDNKTYKNWWYGLYARQKKFGTDAKTLVTNLDSNIKSGMIWGSQYDAMLNWMIARGTNVTSSSRSDGTSKNTSRITGATKNGDVTFNDKIKNIYDILGNSCEWTAEANAGGYRIYRGGKVDNNYAPKDRYYEKANYTGSDNLGSRPYLIVSRSGN